jgi:hypothetical protein
VTPPKKTESKQWTAAQATTFAQQQFDEEGFTSADLFDALDIKQRWSEWKGTLAEAETAVKEWHKRQMAGKATAPAYDRDAVYDAVNDLYSAYPHFTNSLVKLAAEGKIIGTMTTQEVIGVVKAHKAQQPHQQTIPPVPVGKAPQGEQR